MTQHWARGHLRLVPLTIQADRCQTSQIEARQEITLPIRPPSAASPGLRSPKFPQRPRLLQQQSAFMLPPPPGPGDNCPFLMESPASLAADRSCALTGRAESTEGSLGGRGCPVSGRPPASPHTTGHLNVSPPSKGSVCSMPPTHTVLTFQDSSSRF